MQPNKSYLVKIKLKPQFTYLMSDGTTGHFKDTAFGGAPAATAKTPIAVVLDKDNHMGIALKNVNDGAKIKWAITYWYTQSNTHMASGNDALNSQATSGNNETWDPSYTTSAITGNKVKGLNPYFTAFKAAADYDPGTAYTGSPALQWYLPSFSDWKWVYPLGFGDKTAVIQTGNYNWYGNLAAIAFTQVGGTTIDSGAHWSSSEITNIYVGNVCGGRSGMAWYVYDKSSEYYVRPFVKY